MTPNTHPMVQGFDRAAAAYERSRPEYPEAAVAHLCRVLGIGPGRIVLDLGAGTGKLTRAVDGRGATLWALEPTAAMRELLHRRLPEVTLVEGTAEAIALPSESVDAVVCAQAFHWFEPTRATAEIARILRPAGGLGLLWNLRDESVPWVAELTRILDRRDTGVPRGRTMAWKAPFAASGLFEPIAEAEFSLVQRADLETMLDRVRSVSFIALLPSAEQEAVIGEVRRLIDGSPEAWDHGAVVLPYRTHLFWSFRR
ncbi:MAG TPA: class I SAM-dependent methyltransferase [Thermoplasmata archaeon]|nr:class I SAM-dependent methyltransferase [Thermoplasmata archaeon]